MTNDDVLRIELHVLVIAVALLFLPGVPLWMSAVQSAALLLAYFFGILVWDDTVRWSPVLSAVMALTLISLIADNVGRRPSAKTIVAAVLTSVFTGALVYLRKDGYYIAVFPMLGIVIINVTMLLFHLVSALVKRKKTQPSERLVDEFLTSCRTNMRILCYSVVMIVGLTIVPKALLHLNIKVYEIIEQVEHYPSRKGHLVWHPMYIGLGVGHSPLRFETNYTYTYENAMWLDESSISRALQEDIKAVYPGERYEKVVRRIFMGVLKRNTPAVMRCCIFKGTELLRIAEWWVPLTLTLLFALSSLMFFCPGTIPSISTYLFATCLLLFTCAVPPILAVPARIYCVGFLTAVVAVPVFAGVFIIRTMSKFRGKNGGDDAMFDECASARLDEYPNLVKKAVNVVLIVALMLSVTLFVRSGSVYRHRRHLGEMLSSESLDFADLLQEYHADAVSAFNALTGQQRKKLLDKVLSQYGRNPDVIITPLPKKGSLRVLHAAWVEKRVFLLIELRKDLVGEGNIPVNIELYDEYYRELPETRRDSMFSRIPGTGHRRTNSIVLLPRGLKAGVWLFSFSANRDYVKKCVVGDIIVTVAHDAWGKRLYHELYELEPQAK